MRKLVITVALIFPLLCLAQEKNSCSINLKDGKSLSITHFGHLKCGGNVSSNPYRNFIMIRGNYDGQNIEIRDYSNIRKIVLNEFYSKPRYGMGSSKYSGQDKGTIQIYKKNGTSFALSQATIGNSCYGGHWDGVNPDGVYNLIQ